MTTPPHLSLESRLSDPFLDDGRTGFSWSRSAPPTALSLPQVSPGPHLSQAVGVKGLRALQVECQGRRGRDRGVRVTSRCPLSSSRQPTIATFRTHCQTAVLLDLRLNMHLFLHFCDGFPTLTLENPSPTPAWVHPCSSSSTGREGAFQRTG